MITIERAPIPLRVAVLVGCFVASAAPGGAASSALSLPPSIRTAGTGGAGSAAFWGGDPDAWSNPALLGHHGGLRFDSGSTLYDTESGVAFHSARWSAAFGGIGVMGSGTPRGLSGTELTDDALPGTPGRTAQRIEMWGAGISLAEAISSVMTMAGAAPPSLLARFDVAAGAMLNELNAGLIPDAQSRARTTDYGVVARWTPVNTLEPRATAAPEVATPGNWRWPQANDPARTRRARDPRAGMFPDLRPKRTPEPRRFDLAYAYSVKNAGNRVLEHSSGSSDPLEKVARHGASASMAHGRPRRFGGTPWLTRAFTPLYAAGIVGDLERIDPGDGTTSRNVQRYGVEATYANVFTLRRGRVKDAAAGFDGTTFGYSVGLDLGYLGGVRYDRARVPQANGLPSLQRRGITAWVDPMVLLRAARGRRH